MREILFRGQPRFENRWIYGSYVKIGDNHMIVDQSNQVLIGMCYVGCIPETIGQLRHENEHGKYFDGDVYYHAGYGNEVVSGLCQIQLALMSGHDDDIGKIIGNVFENENLITKP